MNTTSMPRAIRLQRSWSARIGDRLADLWARWRERREMVDAQDLDEATLRDMGMPLWMQEEARARREQRELRRDIERVRDRLGPDRYY